MGEHSRAGVDEADARPDLGRATRRSLGRPLRIGDQRASDNDAVAVTAPDRRLGDGRPLDPADRQHRHRQPALQERRDLDVRGLGIVEQGDRVGHRAVDARGDDKRVRAGRRERLRRCEGVLRADSTRRDVVAVQPDDERETRSLSSDPSHDLRPEAGTLGDRVAAVGVGPEIARR